MSTAIKVDEIDGGDRTPKQRAEIERLGQQIATLLASASDPYVLMDVIIGIVVSASLNTGADEDFFGTLIAETMKVFPLFKASREVRKAGRQH